MTPWFTKSGYRRFQRTLCGVRLTNSSGVHYPPKVSPRARRELDREFDRRDDLLLELARHGQVEVLRRFATGGVAIEQLIEAKRQGRLDSPALLAEMELSRPLWDAIELTLPKMGRKAGRGTSQERYTTSFSKLRRVAAAELGPRATVQDLERVGWKKLAAEWPGSGSDWNHMRKAVGAFLTVLLGDVYHPFRRRVMKVATFPKMGESPRVPDLMPATFWRVVARTPEHAQPCYVTLAVTGMRLGEYLRCTAAHLRPATHAIEVPGTKSDEAAATIYVDPDFWPWVEAGVPSPLRSKWIREHWHRACLAEGLAAMVVDRAGKARYQGVTLHDLRHFFAQLASDEGASTAKVQVALRQADPNMARRYEKRRDRGEVARLVGGALKRERTG